MGQLFELYFLKYSPDIPKANYNVPPGCPILIGLYYDHHLNTCQIIIILHEAHSIIWQNTWTWVTRHVNQLAVLSDSLCNAE